MFNLITTTVMAVLLVYGFNEMNVITVDDFEVIQEQAGEAQPELSVKESLTTSKFTDRIVQKRREEGVRS